ncbi:unnamed protein product [Polarella glacialis]|uniref:2'-phosphotransferase n=1 Tax=Polarella glacialis TaxID=89957 RepID=A0A813K6R4_POLGL|nr:unnamed protein product [Polarella glacialis]
MARVLRHTAAGQGLVIRPDGFCPVEGLLALQEFRSFGCSLADVQAAVNNNDKKRFELLQEADQVFVRAVQGHSIKAVADDELLTRLSSEKGNLPTVCVHGTYRRHLASILRQGLLVGGGTSQRNHVHFAPFDPGDGRVISGMRYNCEVAIYLNLEGAIKAGVPFFQSANQVILSPGVQGVVAAEFISKVKDLKTGQWLPSLDPAQVQ